MSPMLETPLRQASVEDTELDPVIFCPKCYSLKIIHEEDLGEDCCMDCGCTETQEAPFEVWEALYERRYGKKFVERQGNCKKSPFFLLSSSKLMEKVAGSARWEQIIASIYKSFPKNLDKADSILLFFDRLVKDNKLNVLRELLYEMKL